WTPATSGPSRWPRSAASGSPCGKADRRSGDPGGIRFFRPGGRSRVVTMSHFLPRFPLAVPVDDLAAAAKFYGGALGCERGRSSDTWIDWNLRGHQFVTHLAPRPTGPAHNEVD